MLVASHLTSLGLHCLASKVGTVRSWPARSTDNSSCRPSLWTVVRYCRLRCSLSRWGRQVSSAYRGKVSPQSQTQMPGVHLLLPPSPARIWLGTCSLSLLATGEAAEGPAREQWGTLRRLLGAKPEVLKGHLIRSNPNCQAFALSFFLCSS